MFDSIGNEYLKFESIIKFDAKLNQYFKKLKFRTKFCQKCIKLTNI